MNKLPIKINKKDYNFISKLLILSVFIIIGLFLYKLLSILIILLFAIFLNVLFSPILNKLNKYKISDTFGITLIYILIWFFIFILVFAIAPIFIKQFSLLINILSDWINNYINIYNTSWINWFNIPWFLKDLLINLDINNLLVSLKDNIWQISVYVSNHLKTFLVSWAWIVSWITSFFTNLILMFIFTFFIATERKIIRNFFYEIIPNDFASYLLKREDNIISSLYEWIKWQMILSVCIFTLTLIWLLLIRLFWVHIEEFFVLALIAWMMEFIPYIWPLIALIPAVAIWLWISVKASIIIFILYIIIQQLENNVLVPYIMWKNLALSSFSVLIAMTIWASLFWILWIIIAIPLVAVLKIFITDLIKYKNKRKN